MAAVYFGRVRVVKKNYSELKNFALGGPLFFISITGEVHEPSGTEGSRGCRGYRPQNEQEEGKRAFSVHTDGGGLRSSQCSQRRKEGAEIRVLKSSEWIAGARQDKRLAARVGLRSAEGGGVEGGGGEGRG